MCVVIPIGGAGEWFRKSGFDLPKALIPVLGKPLLFYLLEGLDASFVRGVAIVYHRDYEKHNLEQLLRESFPAFPFLFHKLDADTRGAADTLRIGIDRCIPAIDMDCPAISLDCDSFYTTNVLEQWSGQGNAVFVVQDASDSAAFSFVVQADGLVKRIVEKRRVSNLACTGAYAWSSARLMKPSCEAILDEPSGERFTSIAVQHTADANEVRVIQIPQSSWHCLGTPADLEHL